MACVMHWRPQGGGSGLGTGPSTARAARRPWSSPERGALAPKACQGLRDIAHEIRGGLGALTQDSNRAGDAAQGPLASTAAGGAGTGTVTRPAQGLSGLLDGTARPKAVLREGYGGQGGSGVTGGEELRWWRCLPAAWWLCSDSRNTGGAA